MTDVNLYIFICIICCLLIVIFSIMIWEEVDDMEEIIDEKVDELILKRIEKETNNFTYKIIKNDDRCIVLQAIEDPSFYLELYLKGCSSYKKGK